MGLLALAFAPGVGICIFIYFKDKYNKEPLGLLLLSFLLGMLTIIPAVIIQIALTKPVEHLMGEGVFYTAVFSYLIVAFGEEGSKYLAVRFFAFKRKAFDDPFDGIVYSIMVGMGFATLENVGYVYQYGLVTGIVRMFLWVPAHATFAVLMGFHIGLAKFDPVNRKKYLLLAVFWPTLFHGTFDFLIFINKTVSVPTWLYFAGAVVSFIVALILSLKLIRKKQKMSRDHHEGVDSITGNDHRLF